MRFSISSSERRRLRTTTQWCDLGSDPQEKLGLYARSLSELPKKVSSPLDHGAMTHRPRTRLPMQTLAPSSAIRTRVDPTPAFELAAGLPATLREALPAAAEFVDGARRLCVGNHYGCKRALDVLGAGLALLLSLPILLLAMLATRLTSRGPVLFRQERVGLHGRRFTLLKLRTMVDGAEHQRAALQSRNDVPGGVIFKIRDDPRVTRVGRLLRRLSIDELPQLVNVLRGDMSLVGPRPPTADEVAGYSAHQRQRLTALPGLTCSWQVQGRVELPFREQVRLDLDYIAQASLLTDLKLLLATPAAVLSMRGAY